MKISLALLLAAASAPLVCTSFAQAPGAAAQGYAAYRLLDTRNIFDPDRRPYVPGAQVYQRPRVVEQPRRGSDYVSLTGVMFEGGKSLAFFSGSRPDYDKVLPLNGEIAGAKVTNITGTGIEVDRSGKKITVNVGQTVPFDNSAPTSAPVPASNYGASDSAAPAANSSQPAPNSTDVNEIMRRMMERRAQQLK